MAVGVGYWGHAPHLVLHPQSHGVQPVPWFVADGYVANYHEVLNALPLIMVTTNWVKETYIRDEIRPDVIDVLHVGCDTDAFTPRETADPRVASVREALGVAPEEIMILTVGGDAASKGSQEMMQALALINKEAPSWKYVCKVWPQPRTFDQNLRDLKLATDLGIEKNVVYTTNVVSRNFMPYLMAACDIYAAPSRLEGFGMPMIEAGACGKPVLSLKAMGMLDTLVHGETAFMAEVAREIRISDATVGEESGYEPGHRVVFRTPLVAEYQADVRSLADYLLKLMRDPGLRHRMGEAGRRRAVEAFDYRQVAKRFVGLVSDRLGIN